MEATHAQLVDSGIPTGNRRDNLADRGRRAVHVQEVTDYARAVRQSSHLEVCRGFWRDLNRFGPTSREP